MSLTDLYSPEDRRLASLLLQKTVIPLPGKEIPR